MAADFATKMLQSMPLSGKQKDAAVMASLLKEHGKAYYDIPLEARGNMREERYAELFLGKAKQVPTQEQVQQVKAHIDALTITASDSLEQDIADVTGIYVPVGTQAITSAAFQQVVPYVEPAKELDAKGGEFIPAGDDHAGFAKAKDILGEAVKETFSLAIELNDKQQLAVDFAEAGKCFVYTGAAGTGKTTGCREIAKKLLTSGKLRKHDFKVRGTGGGRWFGPSIAFCAYTNRAANNMARALHKDPLLEQELQGNILTIHSLLEYEPVFFPREDGTTGMRFEPKRHAGNPLRLTHLVIEESSMLGIDLWLKLFDALPAGCQIIFVGDINQLQPVFATSILNYALITLPVVELTEVYRQALDSPIIANAHRCLRGEKLVTVSPHFRLLQAKTLKKIPSESFVVNTLVANLKKWYDTPDATGQRTYDPEQDIILCPFGKENKALAGMANTTVLNAHIAQFLGMNRVNEKGEKEPAIVYEIIAGMRKVYLAIGDRVMIDKQDGYVTRISHNGNYTGRMAQPASSELTRFGMRIMGNNSPIDEDFELSIQGYESLDVSQIEDIPEEDKKRQASHIVDVLMDSGRTVSLDTAADFSDTWFSLGYALTVHKAQGCEWRKVIILLHRNHAALLSRELIYTAITRAKEYCVIVDLCNQIDKAIATQKIKGNTVQDKIEWFNSKVSLEEPVPVIP